MKSTVILGSGMGDEGKGVMTDFVAALSSNSIVVRHNGGSQAGHTVQLADGSRHVHSHFGSGTLAGYPTYLSKYFISNPHMFDLELHELRKSKKPVVYADKRGMVTTPFDVFINREVEKARGINKHGSCGTGINETVERNLHEEFALTIEDLHNTRILRSKLTKIQQEYVPFRLEQLGVKEPSTDYTEILKPKIGFSFMYLCANFYSHITVIDPSMLRGFDNVVFEGAQGLLLDQHSPYFPHVTRSNTGLKNAHEMALDIGIDKLEVIYVTRPYRTRHGAGILKNELPASPYNIVDLTNVPNPHQDSIRYAYLDLDELVSTINKDFQSVRSSIQLTKSIAVTCVDQIDSTLKYYYHGELHDSSVEKFISSLVNEIKAKRVYTSRGATRETITNLHLTRNKKYDIIENATYEQKQDDISQVSL